MKYMEKFSSAKVLVELDDSTLIYGKIEEEDSGFILIENSLEVTPDGKTYSHGRTVLRKDKIKSVENSEPEEVREIAVERRTYDYFTLIIGAFFGAAILLFWFGLG